MQSKISYLILLNIVLLLLNGCAAAIIAGGATGAAVANDRRTAGTMLEDQSIELKARQEFSADAEINTSSHWNVTSYNTVVLLTGETPNEELRRRMGSIASAIPKVTKVYNELTIAAPSALMSRSSDTVITSKVKSKLLANKEVKGLNIKVVTEKGVVYLMGLVNQAEGDKATEIVRRASGVQKVVKLFQYQD